MNVLTLKGLTYFYTKLKKTVDSLSKNSHTHSNKSALDSITATQFPGNSGTATKLQTARQINGTAFDGSKDITIPIKGCYAYDDSSTATTASWHKVASCTLTNGTDDAYAVFHVCRTADITIPGGILKARVRTTSAVSLESCQLFWEHANNINEEDFALCIVQDQANKTLTAELWVNIHIRYAGYHFTMIADTSRASIRTNKWTLYNSSVGQAAYTEGYKTITSELSTIQNPIELTDSGWAPDNRLILTNVDGGSVLYRKYGKLVEIRGSFSLKSSGEWDIATLPENYRPTSITVSTYAVGNSPVKLEITSDGVISVNGNKDHELINLHVCFLVG